jgi:hypothetical protein
VEKPAVIVGNLSRKWHNETGRLITASRENASSNVACVNSDKAKNLEN